MLLAVVAVLAVGGLAMAANLGLLDLSDRSLQSVDAASGTAEQLGAPLVTAVPSEDGSYQAFVIDDVGMVQLARSLDGPEPVLSITDVEAQAGWKADVVPISPSALRVEFRSARRAMDFEAFVADDGEIAARFRISPRGAPLIVTVPDVAGEADTGETEGVTEAPVDTGSSDSGSDADVGASTATTERPAAGSADPGTAPTTGGSELGKVISESQSTSGPARVDEGTWIYYEDGVYVLENSLRGSGRSQPPRDLSTNRGRGKDKAGRSSGSGRSNGLGNGLLDDD